MNNSCHLFIALRYLLSRKRRRLPSFSTIVSVSGVTIGVASLLIVLSVMSGFHEDLQQKILGASAHVLVQSSTDSIEDYRMIAEEIAGLEGVAAASPVLTGQVMLSRGNRAHGVVIRGVIAGKEKSTTDISARMRIGSLDAIEREGDFPGIVIGGDLASSLGVVMGDTVTVVSPMGEMGPFGLLPRAMKFRVAGIFEMGMYEYDANLAIVPLRHLQKFLRTGDSVNAIELKLSDVYRAPHIRDVINDRFGPGLYARDWMDMNRTLFSALRLEKLAMFIILTLIVLVAAFNIVSTLIMNVVEKEREIAILKTMGTTNSGIMKIFMIQGLIIGIMGTAMGLVAGTAISYLINTYELVRLPSDIYYLDHLPVKMNPLDFITVCASALLISFLATIYPARQAARLTPLEALRYE